MVFRKFLFPFLDRKSIKNAITKLPNRIKKMKVLQNRNKINVLIIFVFSKNVYLETSILSALAKQALFNFDVWSTK